MCKNLAINEGVDGYCFNVEGGRRSREYEISIDNGMTFDNFIKTLLHEFIHVKQYVTGELFDSGRGKAKTTWKEQDHSRTPYSKQPWEREAYRLQEKLYNEFMTTFHRGTI